MDYDFLRRTGLITIGLGALVIGIPIIHSYSPKEFPREGEYAQLMEELNKPVLNYKDDLKTREGVNNLTQKIENFKNIEEERDSFNQKNKNNSIAIKQTLSFYALTIASVGLMVYGAKSKKKTK
jgi:hypothetical protein